MSQPEMLMHVSVNAAKYEESKDIITYTTALSERSFCAHCASPILMRYFCTRSTLHIPLGLLEPPAANDEAVTEAYRPRQDIWTSSRAWWMSPPTEEENGGREQYKEDDEEFMELCRKWKEEHEPR